MDKTDVSAGLGFLGTFATYYANAKYHFANGINPVVYDWTIGGLPEFFTGMATVCLADKLTPTYNKAVEKLNLNKLKMTSKTAMKLGGLALLALATTDECVYNISHGMQDPSDIAKYGAGLLTAYVGKTKNAN